MVHGNSNIGVSNSSLLSEIFITSFAQPTSLYREQHVYIYSDMSDTVHTVYELPLLPNNTAGE